jgi:hypothetical protein
MPVNRYESIMLTPTQIARAKPKLVLIQIISAGILFGAIMFTGVILSMTDWSQFPGDGRMMSLLGAITGFAMLGLAWIVPSLIATSPTQIAAEVIRFRNPEQADQLDDKIIEGLLASLVTGRIVFSAIIEGAIFLNLMVFFIERNTINLALVGFGLLTLIVTFPLQSRLLGKTTDQIRHVKDEMKLIG